MQWAFPKNIRNRLGDINGKFQGVEGKSRWNSRGIFQNLRKNFFQEGGSIQNDGNFPEILEGVQQTEIDVLNIGGTVLFCKNPVTNIGTTASFLLYFSMRTNTKHFSCKRSGCGSKNPHHLCAAYAVKKNLS